MSTPSARLSRRDFIRLTSVAAAGTAATSRAWAQPTEGPSPKKLGVALLGLGKYSTNELAPALQFTKNCELRGIVTGTPSKVDTWVNRFRLNRKNVYSYETLDSIANNPDIDIVYVVTPPGVRRQFVERVAKAGKHVISEKPFATTVEDCQAMIDACNKARVQLSVGYRLHFDPYHRIMMQWAADPSVGPFKTMAGNRGFVFKTRAWRVDKKLAGGGPMMDLGIYIIHGACLAANSTPVSVTAQEHPKTRPDMFNEVEETMSWAMEFPNGAHCDGIAGFNHTSDTFRAQAAKVWIDFREHAFTYRGISCYTSSGPVHFDPPVHQQSLQMDDFADCVRTGRKTALTGELGLRDIRILTAIYEAARTGKSVAV